MALAAVADEPLHAATHINGRATCCILRVLYTPDAPRDAEQDPSLQAAQASPLGSTAEACEPERLFVLGSSTAEPAGVLGAAPIHGPPAIWGAGLRSLLILDNHGRWAPTCICQGPPGLLKSGVRQGGSPENGRGGWGSLSWRMIAVRDEEVAGKLFVFLRNLQPCEQNVRI